MKVPPALVDALGNHVVFYRRALIARHVGHSIGAHAYFRRVVEETMDELLTHLAAILTTDGAKPDVIKNIQAAQTRRVFEKKAEIAAKFLPKRLCPNGFNPFGSLHDFLSTNLHGKTDEECVAAVDRAREDLDILFKMLKTHVADLSAYGQASKNLQRENDPAQRDKTKR